MNSTKEINMKIMPMLISLVAYEVSHDLRVEAEKKNREEQQKAIEPLFYAHFHPITSKYSYSDSWKLGMEKEIEEWEEQNGIEEICNRIASKNSKQINELMRLEKEAAKNLCNAALDVLEKDAIIALTKEQMYLMREKINVAGWSYERQKMCEWIVEFARKRRSEVK